MKKLIIPFVIIIMFYSPFSGVYAMQWPSPPQQDEGLPYTRSSQIEAHKVLDHCIGLFVGSRYAWVYGKKVRLDDAKLMRGGEPVFVDGEVFIPACFASVVGLSVEAVVTDKAPIYLEERWVYTIKNGPHKSLKKLKTIDRNGEKYLSLKEVLAYYQKQMIKHDNGLVLIGRSKDAIDALLEANATIDDQQMLDNLVVQFDTPEKYMMPELATKYIPLLAKQGQWTDHLDVTDEEMALLEGDEHVWPEVPTPEFNLKGFDEKLLGSKVPAPGVYPRLLFNDKDLEAIRKRIDANVIAQKSMIELEVLLNKSWLNPEAKEYEIFTKLAHGDTSDLQWDAWRNDRRIPDFPGLFTGQKPSVYTSHVFYNSRCLVSIALYAMIKGDDELGQKTANALANIYRMQETNLDAYLKFSDSELGSNPGDAGGSTTQWRGMANVIAHMDLPFALDFAGKWMTEDQKQDMYRIIAKATYGRRNNGGDGPRRAWRDINHVTWHMTHLLSLAAIEGQEGFDKEAYASGEELVADFLQWGVDADGMMYESNGKSGGGLQFQVLCMITMARRGHNLWGHPHWRELMKAQVLNASPNALTTVSSGTWSGGALATPSIMMYKAFYPEDKYADIILSREYKSMNLKQSDLRSLDLAEYRKELTEKSGRVRIPGVSLPGFSLTVLYDTDWESMGRHDVEDLPLEYVNEDYGVMSIYSDASEDAAWMNLFVRSNHYLGAGHHHADAGMFHFSALGVNWFTESPFQKAYDGKFHNQVLIDGISEPDGIQGRADWLGCHSADDYSFASCDLTNSYTYRWANQFILFDTDDWGPRPDQFEWELCKDPYAINAFKGTQHYKMRPWWPTGIFSNWFPVLQYKYNPMEYVYRTAGLIKGTHDYGILIDDVKKDDEIHLYQWSAMTGRGVWVSRFDEELPKNMMVLAKKGDDVQHAGDYKYRPNTGDPMLLVVVLGGEGVPDDFETNASKASRFALNPYGVLNEQVSNDVKTPVRIESVEGPIQNPWAVQFFYDRVVAGCHSKEVHYRTLLIPFRKGEKLPQVSYEDDRAVLTWDDQKDTITFQQNDDRTTFIFKRDRK